MTVSPDYRHARVELRMRPWNRNYVGTHFGGSLFAMTDPFWMLLVLQSLGRDYIVWDQAGEIEFLKPGRRTVHARFDLDDATLDAIRAATVKGEKHLRWFETLVTNDERSGRQTAQAAYVRRKRDRASARAQTDRCATGSKQSDQRTTLRIAHGIKRPPWPDAERHPPDPMRHIRASHVARTLIGS